MRERDLEMENGWEAEPGYVWCCSLCGRMSKNRLVNTGEAFCGTWDVLRCCVKNAIHWPRVDLHFELDGEPVFLRPIGL